ncbi:MAG: penicillin-binding protein 2, partial [Butyrivibrio sp.]|nr:penicillin-binding protein 2 [Butyrivibrio sp.]
MQLSIGQGATSVTPMHMNMITCAIANGGMLKKPYLVSEIKSEDGKSVKTWSSEDYKRLMTKEQSDILVSMMEEVVNTGTASKLKGLSYTSAGKTGSAEFTDSTTDSHAWFTGFAPAEDPEICVTIIVENAGSGGSFAVPIAKRIFDAYFGVD